MGDGLAQNEVKTNQTCEKMNGFMHDLDYMAEEWGLGEGNISLRRMFDKVLSEFLSERRGPKWSRSVPALCGDGRQVDLFKLFWVVRKIGGYDVVCRKNLWGFIAVQCGLGFGAIAPIKLVYAKYLSDFDLWLWNTHGENSSEDEDGGICQKLDLLSWKLEARFRGLSASEREEKKVDNEVGELGYDKPGKGIELENGESEGLWSDEEIHVNPRHSTDIDDGKIFTENDNGLMSLGKKVVERSISKMHYDPEQNNEDDGKSCFREDNDIVLSAKTVLEKIIDKVHSGDDNTMVSSKNVVEEVIDSRKRKRESFSFLGMLNWIKNAAKHSDDPSVGKIPESSKWKDHGPDELWIQALLSRESLLIRRHTKSNPEESPFQQKKPRMHPSMYENDHSDYSSERLRGNRRFSSETIPHVHLCNSTPATPTKVVNCQKTESDNNLKEHQSVDVLETNMKNDACMDESPRAHVSVGPLFQAEVPEWAGSVSDSDSKWLGIRMWPLEDGKCKDVMDLHPIGKGRRSSCDCPFPDSVECIRFHIAEKRFELKQELGSVFHRWGFNRMGEEVSLSWTAEEESKFKNMVMLNAASQNQFLNNAPKHFHSKTREMLVSYYFNVYLVQRRSYQNRVTPKDIDSDDDEKPVGSVGDLFGYKALKVPGTSLLTCSENKQFTDL